MTTLEVTPCKQGRYEVFMKHRSVLTHKERVRAGSKLLDKYASPDWELNCVHFKPGGTVRVAVDVRRYEQCPHIYAFMHDERVGRDNNGRVCTPTILRFLFPELGYSKDVGVLRSLGFECYDMSDNTDAVGLNEAWEEEILKRLAQRPSPGVQFARARLRC